MTICNDRWADIDLSAVQFNYNQIKSCLSNNTKYLSIMKADAYGHGSAYLAPYISQLGADYFGVATLSEAIELRNTVPDKPILILGYTAPSNAEVLIQNRITQSVFSLEYAELLNQNAGNCNQKLDIHLAIDVGMGRIGFLSTNKQTIDSIRKVAQLKSLHISGIFTHFPNADSNDIKAQDQTLNEFRQFMDLCENLTQAGINVGIKHCANSAIILTHPEMQLDMVRSGVIQFGMSPSDCLRNKIPLKPVMSLYCLVSMVKEIPAGYTISYGSTFIAPQKMKIATCTIGYADGFLRSFGNQKSSVLIHGQKASVLGRVCMDQMMVDVSQIENVQPGDTVTIIGQDQQINQRFEDFAPIADTINYELSCMIGSRVTRIFK